LKRGGTGEMGQWFGQLQGILLCSGHTRACQSRSRKSLRYTGAGLCARIDNVTVQKFPVIFPGERVKQFDLAMDNEIPGCNNHILSFFHYLSRRVNQDTAKREISFAHGTAGDILWLLKINLMVFHHKRESYSTILSLA
jgi:hypothetical protein